MADACCAHDEAPAGADDDAPTSLWRIPSIRASLLAGVLLGAGFGAGAAGSDLAATVLYAAALVVGGSTFVPETLQGLRRGRLGVGTLMTIAAAGAVALGEFGEAASLAFLFSIAEALEGYAMARTRRGLRALLALVPERVMVRRGGQDVEIDPSELRVGDTMVVKPGERVATDGVVSSGRSTLDVSAITGESVPVEVEPGREVFAASINGGGVLQIEVTARTSDSSLARVVQIVEEAQQRKGASQRLAERIAEPLVPVILVAAALVAVVGSILGEPSVWIHRALVVLVAASPCAFAIAVPVTVVAAIGAGAKGGSLIKGGAALEALARVRVMALDKTGTLTRNQPAVIEVVTNGRYNESDVLRVAAALERHSEHPLAAAILAAHPASGPDAEDVQAVIGNGLSGAVEGRSARLGKPGFIEPAELTGSVERLQELGATVVLVELDNELLGAVAVRDELRPEAAAAIAAMRSLGVERVAMLTGDNQRTAAALARSVGVDEVHAELLPEDKVRLVTTLQQRGAVAMVGDGVNDAPALATADVGLAMGAMGSDVAIEAADVALMGEQLTHVPEVLAHARRAGRIMRQNLALSGLIIAVLIPMGAFGVLGLAAVVGAHEIAEVFVIANGVRAGRRPKRAAIPAGAGPADQSASPPPPPPSNGQTTATGVPEEKAHVGGRP